MGVSHLWEPGAATPRPPDQEVICRYTDLPARWNQAQTAHQGVSDHTPICLVLARFPGLALGIEALSDGDRSVSMAIPSPSRPAP